MEYEDHALKYWTDDLKDVLLHTYLQNFMTNHFNCRFIFILSIFFYFQNAVAANNHAVCYPSKCSNITHRNHCQFSGLNFNHSDTCSPLNTLPDTFVHRIFTVLSNDEFLNNYEATLKFMRLRGLNELSIWDLIVKNSWPLKIEHTLDDKKSKQILKLIETAHHYGIKVLFGFSAFGLEFTEIIRANPQLACTLNSNIICPDNSEAWIWQKKIIDYVFSFPIDGVTIQCSKQGRCKDCKELNTVSDVAYHAVIIDKTAAYIRQKFPNKIIGINNNGLNLGNPLDLPEIKKLASHADFLIDLNNSASGGGKLHLCNLVRIIQPCYYGAVASPAIPSPKILAYDHWFLPLLRNRSMFLKKTFKAGSRAIENYAGSIKNPGDEVSTLLAAALEKNPSAIWEAELNKIISELYQPTDSTTLEYLTQLYLKSEFVYFDYAQKTGDFIFLDTISSDSTKRSVYLIDHMNQEGLNNYKKELCVLRRVFSSLSKKIKNTERLNSVVNSIDGTIDEINILTHSTTGCVTTASKESAKTIAEHTLRISIAYFQKQDEIKLQIYNPQSWHKVDLKIQSLTGKTLSTKEIVLIPGINEYSIADHPLPDGLYFIEIIDPDLKNQSHLKLIVD